MIHSQQGQSIIEIIIAMAIGVILIIGSVAAIAPLLKISSDVAHIQTSSALGKELLDNVGALARSDWHAIDSLSTSSAYQYYLVVTTSPFTVVTGTESVAVATTSYARWFYLDDVYRDVSGKIAGSGAFDPSTKKITVVYRWLGNASNTIVSYLARTRDSVWSTVDWSGGGNQSGPVTVTSTNAAFATSSGIDYAIHAGSIVITGF